VVIVGGGFAGLEAARTLGRASVELTLVDRRNFHLFQPLLYQVATGGLSPADISSPLRALLAGAPRARVLQAEVETVDAEARQVVLGDGERLDYDTLILAPGARHHYFGHDDWERAAPGLKTVEDATRMRSRILGAFEAAERARDEETRRRLLTFVIVGGGPTGVELAGAIGELARYTLRRDFRAFRTEEARVLLVEAEERVLPTYRASLSAPARRSLERLGVEVRTSTLVERVENGAVTLSADGGHELVSAANVLWAAGVQASPLGRRLASCVGAETDSSGRLHVDDHCAIPGHPELLVLGDLARFVQDGAPLPAVAAVAVQQGRYAAGLVRARLRGRDPGAFRYRDKGTLAVIGRAAAVADFGRFTFTGQVAWLLWLFIHIMLLVGFENRVLVFTQWAFSYVTRNRGARLITGARD